MIPAVGDGVATRGSTERLPPKVVQRILLLLADWWKPDAIARQVATEFGIVPPHISAIKHYRQSKKHRHTIEQIREALRKSVDDIPIANRRYRLLVLQRELEHARKNRVTGKLRDGTVIRQRPFEAITNIMKLASQEAADPKGQAGAGQKFVLLLGKDGQLNINNFAYKPQGQVTQGDPSKLTPPLLPAMTDEQVTEAVQQACGTDERS